jgi:ABC-type Co2+ transport system permease subunit
MLDAAAYVFPLIATPVPSLHPFGFALFAGLLGIAGSMRVRITRRRLPG